MKTKHLRTLLLTTLLSGAVSLVPNSVLARGGGGSHGGGTHSSSYSSGSRGGSIHVSGYTRSNGTYVHSYTRATSRSGLGYSTGSEYSDDSGESSNSTDPNSISTTSNHYQDALDSAMSAATVTQSAVSKDDWELVTSKWENAISLLKELPNASPNYVAAQVKIQEYGRNLNYARQQLDLPPLTQPNEESLAKNSASVAALASPQATAATTSVSRPSQVTPTPATGVTPTSESNESNYPIGVISLTVLIVIAGIGFYKFRMLAKATMSLKFNGVPVAPTNNSTTQVSDQKVVNKAKDFSNQILEKSTDINQESIKNFTQAIRLNPDAEAYFTRGVAYENLGFYKEALKDFNQAIRLNSAKVIYYSRRGSIRQKLGDTLGANWDFNTAKTLSDPSTGSTKAKFYVRQPLPAQPKTMKVSDEDELEDYYFEKEFKLPEFHLPEVVNRVGSIALGLGALVAFGLINQKMGGGSVQVSSYRKTNGTFVHSHTRHRPR